MADFDPEAQMQARRGPDGDEDVNRWLRGRSDEECFTFIPAFIRFRGYGNEQHALDLPKSSIRQPTRALAILLDSNPPTLDMALYWLSDLLPPADYTSRAALQSLHSEAELRDLLRWAITSRTQAGRTAFSVIRAKNELGPETAER